MLLISLLNLSCATPQVASDSVCPSGDIAGALVSFRVCRCRFLFLDVSREIPRSKPEYGECSRRGLRDAQVEKAGEYDCCQQQVTVHGVGPSKWFESDCKRLTK